MKLSATEWVFLLAVGSVIGGCLLITLSEVVFEAREYLREGKRLREMRKAK